VATAAERSPEHETTQGAVTQYQEETFIGDLHGREVVSVDLTGDKNRLSTTIQIEKER
jgi:hypothetical protein